MASPSPTTYLALLDNVVDFALRLAEAGDRFPVAPPPDVAPELVAEVRQILERVREAQNNRITVPWDNRSYDVAVGGHEGRTWGFEIALQEQFRPLGPISINQPTLFEDVKRQALVYYLSDCISEDRQARIADSIGVLAPTLRANGPKVIRNLPGAPRSQAAWRNAENLFLKSHQCDKFGRGNISGSPAWQQQAKTGWTNSIHVSADLAPPPGRRGPSAGQLGFQKFFAENLETGLLVSTALVLTHPEQYALTRASLERLSTIDHISERLLEWSFSFNVVTVIANRQAPFHRDRSSGGSEWMEVLLTVGGDAETVLELPGIGARFQYRSGTMALFAGYTHLHGVSESCAERVCIASYARPSVQRLFRLHNPDPPTVARSLHHNIWRQYITDILSWARQPEFST
ncbi:unnamed protein product [Peniophora sp. CBMAI 1063]|nr:unnamed protein product [Peniophora sp. CBMAI 1063]